MVPGPDTDVTRPRDDFDLPGIHKYAESKHVRLWTWVHQAALRGRVEEAFTAFEKMGWSGMMVDFFDHDDQETVEFAEEILQAAARHHIAIHFHGIWKPTGMQRTYPNLMTTEAVKGFEFATFTQEDQDKVVRHAATLPFARNLFDPMLRDYSSVPVYQRNTLKPGQTLQGPAIIAEDETTTIITSGFVAALDPSGAIRLTTKSAALQEAAQ